MANSGIEDIVDIFPKWKFPGSATGLYKEGQPLNSGDVISLADELMIRYEFGIGEDEIQAIALNTERSYPIATPPWLEWGSQSYPFYLIVEEGGTEYVLGYADVVGAQAFLTFEGSFWDAGHDLTQVIVDQIYFQLPCRLNSDVASLSLPEVEIELLGGDEIELFVLENQKSRHEVTKTASAFANDQIGWEVVYLPGAVDSLYPLTLTDTWDHTVHILIPQTLQATRNGEPVAVLQNHENGETVLAIVLEDYSPEPITLTYQTRLADEKLAVYPAGTTDLVLSNTADILDQEGDSQLDMPCVQNADVAWNNRIMSQKSGTQSGRDINWTLTLNPRQRVLDGLVLNDTIPLGLILVGGITVINLDSGMAADVAVSTEPTSFRIECLEPVSIKGYHISYKTTIDDAMFDGSVLNSYTNTAILDMEWTPYLPDGQLAAPGPVQQNPSATVTIESRVISKSGAYNRSTGILTWTVRVNPYAVDVQNLVITENLELNIGYPTTYVDGSFSSTSPLISLDSVDSTNKVLTFLVGDIGTQTHALTFMARLDDPRDFAGNFPYDSNGAETYKRYYNTVSFLGEIQIWEEEALDPSIGNCSGSFQSSALVYSRILDKIGTSYEVDSHTATWSLTINKNNGILTEVLLADRMPPGSEFIPGSVLIDGNPPASEIAITYAGSQLMISLPLVTAQMSVTYQTLLDPDLIAGFKDQAQISLQNEANLTHDEGPEEGVTESAQLMIANQLIEKYGEFSDVDKVLNYKVHINPHNLTLEDAYVYDEIPTGLQLDITSVALYEATVDKDGDFFKGPLKYAFDAAGFHYTLNAFELKLPDGKGSYILEFDCYITAPGTRTFINQVELRDAAGLITSDPAESEDVTDVGNSGSGVSSKRVRLNVMKVDARRPCLKLAGIRLELYQQIGSEGILIMEGQTDSQGTAVFYPLKDKELYFIKEAAPGIAGYNSPIVLTAPSDGVISVSDFPGEGDRLSFRLNQSGGQVDWTLGNEPIRGDLSFLKTTDRLEKGVFLPVGDGEAVFKFTDQTPLSGEGCEPFVQTAATDASGDIQLLDTLPFGRYRVEEVSVAPYHTLAAPFVIDIGADGVVSGLPDTVENCYFRPDFYLAKYQSDGTTPIAGVGFELLDGEGYVVAAAVTDSGGELVFEDLYGGESYGIRETGSPLPRYYETGVYQTGAINQAEDYHFSWRNYEHAAVLELTKADEMREGVKLAGAGYDLYQEDPTFNAATLSIASGVSDTFGRIRFEGLPLNQDRGGGIAINSEPALLATDYWVVETAAPTGYLLDPTPVKVTLDPLGKSTPRTATYSKSLFNDPIHHSEVELNFLKKTNKIEDYTLGAAPLPGQSFTLRDQTPGSSLTRNASSDGSGLVNFGNLPFGAYSLTENSPALYHKPLLPVAVIFDEGGNCTHFNGIDNPQQEDFFLENEVFDPNLTILKMDEAGKPLPNVAFELCEASGSSFDPPRHGMTDAEGIVTFAGLLGGDTYVVKETAVPNPWAHYKSSNFLIGPINQQKDFLYPWTNYAHKAVIRVKKTDTRPGVVVVGGVKFELYRSQWDGEGFIIDWGSLVDTAITNAFGVAEFGRLPLAQDVSKLGNERGAMSEPFLLETTYWLVEAETAAGYDKITEPIPVILNAGNGAAIRTQTQEVIVPNPPKSGAFEFLKFTDRDPSALLEGAVFRIADQTPGSAFLSTADSDAFGRVVFENIPFGTYSLTELNPPPYHQPAFLGVELTISPQGVLTHFNGYEDLLGVGMEFLTLENQIKKTSLVLTKTSSEGGLLPNTEFQLYRVSGPNEFLIATQSTDGFGTLEFSNLLMGGETYRIYETQNPLPGFYETQSLTVDVIQPLSAADPLLPLEPYLINWKNYTYSAAIKLTKYDALRPQQGGFGGLKIGGAQFALYNQENCIGPYLYSGATDGDGALVFSGLPLLQAARSGINSEPKLSETSYYLKEIAPADGYEPNTDIHEVKLLTRTQQGELAIYNMPLTRSISFKKMTDLNLDLQPGQTDGTALPGIRFLLTDTDPEVDFSLVSVSDALGIVTFEGVPHGSFLIQEQNTPARYQPSAPIFLIIDKDMEITEFSTILGELKGKPVLVNNVRRATLRLQKTDSHSNPLAGVGFALYRMVNGIPVALGVSGTTDENGVAIFSQLAWEETYVIREVQNPYPGFYQTGDYQLTLDKNEEDYHYHWINYSWEAAITVTKKEPASIRQGVLIPGAVFTLYTEDPAGLSDSQLVAIYKGSATTDSQGSLTFSGLSLTQDLSLLETNAEPKLLPTSYWLVENSAPAGYGFISVPVKVTLVSRNEDQAVIVENLPRLQDVSFLKTNDWGRRLEGAVFQLQSTAPASPTLWTRTSNSAGEVLFEDIPQGHYLLKETAAPDYHLLDLASYTFEITPLGAFIPGPALQAYEDANGEIWFPNSHQKAEINVEVRDGDTAAPLSLTLEIVDKDGIFRGTQTTDSGGVATFGGLMRNETYLIREHAIEGYYPTADALQSVGTQAVAAVVPWIKFPYAARLNVTKFDLMRPGVLLEGASFTLYYPLPGGGGPDLARPHSAHTTLAGGTCLFSGLPLNVSLGGMAQSQTEPIFEATSFWLVETASPDGYLPSAAAVEVILDPKSTLNNPRLALYEPSAARIPNDPAVHEDIFLRFQKVSNKQLPYTLGESPLASIWFYMKDRTPGSSWGQWAVSDPSGWVEFFDIPFGRYLITEVLSDKSEVASRPPFHKELPGFEVEFDKNGDCIFFNGIMDPSDDDFKIVNEILRPEVTLIKTDEDEIPMEGIEFELCDSLGSSLTPPYTKRTDSQGRVVFEGLVGGDDYRIKEVASNPSYYQPGTYELPAVDDPGFSYTCHWYNNSGKASIALKKIDAQTKKPIPGAVFELYPSNAAKTAPQGLPIGEAATDSQGLLTFKNIKLDQKTLTIGTPPQVDETVFWLVEKEAALDYFPNSYPYFVSLTAWDEQNTDWVTNPIENQPLKVFVIIKTGTNGKPLSGVWFDLYQVIDGQRVWVKSRQSSEDGEAKLTDLVGGAAYVITERVPEGFYPTGEYEIPELDENEVLQINWINYPFEASISLKKVDKERPILPVSGALFGLYDIYPYDKSPEELEGHLIQSQKTDGDGLLAFENLQLHLDPLGKLAIDKEPPLLPTDFYVMELEPAEGYYLNNAYCVATLTSRTHSHSNWISLPFLNPPVTGDLDFIKYSNRYPQATLPDIPFTLQSLDDPSWTRAQSSDTEGKVHFAGLPFGEYRLTETSIPLYHLPQVSLTVVIGTDGAVAAFGDETDSFVLSQPLSIINKVITLPALIVKVDDQDNLIPGILFELYRQIEGSWVLDDSSETIDPGVAIFNGLFRGEVYILKEKTPPTGYYQSGELKVEVDSGPFIYVWRNYPFKAAITLKKVDSLNHEPVEGAVFTLYEDDGSGSGPSNVAVKTAATNEFGAIVFGELPLIQDPEPLKLSVGQPPAVLPTTYWLVETAAAPGYELDPTPYPAILTQWDGSVDDYRESPLANRPVNQVLIRKRDDEGVPLAGAVFELYRLTGGLEELVGKEMADSGGEVVFSGLVCGFGYVIRELPLTGYYESADFTIDYLEPKRLYETEWVNFRYRAAIEITKRDSLDPSVLLPGAVFELYAYDGSQPAGPVLATAITNSSGKGVFENLPLTQLAPGASTTSEAVLAPTAYYLREIFPPDGYRIDEPHRIVGFEPWQWQQPVTLDWGNLPIWKDVVFDKRAPAIVYSTMPLIYQFSLTNGSVANNFPYLLEDIFPPYVRLPQKNLVTIEAYDEDGTLLLSTAMGNALMDESQLQLQLGTPLPPHGYFHLSAVMELESGIPDGHVLDNTATLSHPALETPLVAAARSIVKQVPVFGELSKVEKEKKVTENGIVEYTLTVQNMGTSVLGGELAITDQFPPGLDLSFVLVAIDGMPTSNVLISSEAGSLQMNLLDEMPALAALTIILRFLVPEAFPLGTINTQSFLEVAKAGISVGTVNNEVEVIADTLIFNKSASAGEVGIGEEVEYTLSVVTGDFDLKNGLVFTETLDPDLVFLPGTMAEVRISYENPVPYSEKAELANLSDLPKLRFELPIFLGSRASVTLTYRLTIGAGAENNQKIINTAWVDNGYHMFQSTAAITAVSSGLSSHRHFTSKPTVEPGGNVQYHVESINGSGWLANELSWTIQMPPGVTVPPKSQAVITIED